MKRYSPHADLGLKLTQMHDYAHWKVCHCFLLELLQIFNLQKQQDVLYVQKQIIVLAFASRTNFQLAPCPCQFVVQRISEILKFDTTD